MVLGAIRLALKEDKRRITAIISEQLEQEIQQFSEVERRSKSSMTAILLEEAIKCRKQQKKEGKGND
jgi:hypothetical protein